ncbi:MAG: prepilin-type N-terminal cleavage/methylation domain-containing protein [Desulfitobacteriaceae bacterium]
MRIGKLRNERGFTLLEVMMVIVIIAVLTAIATQKFVSSAEMARRNADIATGHQLKTALDRFQVENGLYPKKAEVSITAAGVVTAPNFIPKYLSKLDKTTTQQKTTDTQTGFGLADLPASGIYADTPTNLVMIYLNATGSGAEVRVFNDKLETTALWASN